MDGSWYALRQITALSVHLQCYGASGQGMMTACEQITVTSSTSPVVNRVVMLNLYEKASRIDINTQLFGLGRTFVSPVSAYH